MERFKESFQSPLWLCAERTHTALWRGSFLRNAKKSAGLLEGYGEPCELLLFCVLPQSDGSSKGSRVIPAQTPSPGVSCWVPPAFKFPDFDYQPNSPWLVGSLIHKANCSYVWLAVSATAVLEAKTSSLFRYFSEIGCFLINKEIMLTLMSQTRLPLK